MARYWFRQRLYGYGGTPVTWEGWAVVAAFAAALAALAFAVDGAAIPLAHKPLWFAGLAFLLLIPFLWLCRRKTEGGWRWRWGA